MSSKKQKALIALVSLFLSPAAFALSPLSGTYQPIASSGCAHLKMNPQQIVTVIATATKLQAGPYEFNVGTVNLPPPPGIFNEFSSQFVGQYSRNGNQFQAIENIIDRLNPSVIYKYAGEVDFVLNSDTLEISDSLTTDGQFNPAPIVTCSLTKIN